MKHIKLLTIITLIFTSINAESQVELPGKCGTVSDQASIELLKQNIKQIALDNIEMRSGVTRYVPVTFHFIADDDGNGYPREEQALEQLASLNELYAPQEFIFYIDEIKYTADSRIYNAPAGSAGSFQMRLVKDGNSMNVYVTQSADTEGGAPGGQTRAYYSPGNDWIVIRKDGFGGITGDLGHETGHFFTLVHTHQGWDCEPYDEETHGNPLNSIWSPCGSIRAEYANGSNCSNSGDFICDTPPDYNFGFGWNTSGEPCREYDKEVKDPNGDIVDPQETNIMGYFIGCAQYEFSNTQQNIIRNDFQSSRRSYLRTGVIPNTDPVTDDVVYNYPINDEESPTFNQIEFDWEDVEGANQYLFIIDRFSTFTFMSERFIVDASNITIDELPSGAKYYWKVWPFNESQTDAGYSATQSFFVGTSTAVNEISSVETFNVYPNPVTDGRLLVAIQSTGSFDANLRIVDLSGRIIQNSFGHKISADDHWSVELNTEGMSAGLYIVQVVSDKGILTSKFAVQ